MMGHLWLLPEKQNGETLQDERLAEKSTNDPTLHPRKYSICQLASSPICKIEILVFSASILPGATTLQLLILRRELKKTEGIPLRFSQFAKK